MPAPHSDHAPTVFVARLSAALAGDERVEGLWLEGPDDSVQWPPYEHLDLHFAVPEPHIESVRTGMQELLGRCGEITEFSQQEAPLQGYAGHATLAGGHGLTYRIERTSQIAKVPRRRVNVLLDRSAGLLIPALDFE